MEAEVKQTLAKLIITRKHTKSMREWTGESFIGLKHRDIGKPDCLGGLTLWKLDFREKIMILSCEYCPLSVKMHFSEFLL